MLNQDTSRGLFFHRCLLSITYFKLLEILNQLNHKNHTANSNTSVVGINSCLLTQH